MNMKNNEQTLQKYWNTPKWNTPIHNLFDRNSLWSSFDSVMSEVFDNAFPLLDGKSSLSIFEKVAYPKLNIFEEKDKFVVEVETAGWSKEDIKLEVVQDNILVVRGDKKQVKEDSRSPSKFLRRELKRSSFNRQICRLNDNCDKDKITANFNSGLLVVTIPKKNEEPLNQKEEVRKINII